MAYRLGAGNLGVFRLGGDLPTLFSEEEIPAWPAFRQQAQEEPPPAHRRLPVLQFSASMRLDLELFASVEVVGIEEDLLLLIGAA